MLKILNKTCLTLKTFSKSKNFPSLPSEACHYKIIPKIDQSLMFEKVTHRLCQGDCVGIFPEGGSHDRSEMLPLKPGAAIMALSTLYEHPLLPLSIIPCGLNYFNADKFRSRAVIEYGPPIQIKPEWVEQFAKGGQERKDAVQNCTTLMRDRLKELTLNVPDYEQLLVRVLFFLLNRFFL